LDKKILVNQLESSKKKLVIVDSFQRQNRQGFLRFYPLKTLILQVLLKVIPAKTVQKRFTVTESVSKKKIEKCLKKFRLCPA